MYSFNFQSEQTETLRNGYQQLKRLVSLSSAIDFSRYCQEHQQNRACHNQFLSPPELIALMDASVSSSKTSRYLIFLNVSFLLVLCFYTSSVDIYSSRFSTLSNSNGISEPDCSGLNSIEGNKAKCLYLKSNSPCVSQGYIDYIYLFYCTFGQSPILCYLLLFLWLLILFYLLGNTASEYFCTSLEDLSRILKLSPTIAGVTLLSLGNGAPDVLATVVSFMGNGTRELGLNTVLGGSSFITCVVVGVISIFMHSSHVRVNKDDFVRDVCFLLLVLASLVVILLMGEIDIWVAMGFSSLYFVYVFVVYVSHTCWKRGGDEHGTMDALTAPILQDNEDEEVQVAQVEDEKWCFCISSTSSWGVFLYILEMPLYLPRRLTIPVVCEKRWSKPIGVASVILAPLFLALLWNSQMGEGMFSKTSVVINNIGLLFGFTFGVLAFVTTEKSNPPKKCLIVWLAGGFLMSVTWSYITAQELVGLLVSFGFIFGISPSILGLTVLAWGNSLGDLITNLTLARTGGAQGAQIAFSGCYAGPIFNTLVGVGLSLVGSSLYGYPSSVVITSDPYLLETLGFLMVGLLWALVILPWREMKIDGVLGGGLLAVYLISISLRLIQTLGSLQYTRF